MKKHQIVLRIAIGMVPALACLLAATDVGAIPAFSRTHKTECSTCHNIYPELNEFGDAFYKNSFVWPEAKGTGKNRNKEQKDGASEAFWLSGIPEVIPISLSAGFNAVQNDKAEDSFDLNTRFLTLHGGGAFRDQFGFFASYYLYSQGYSPRLANVPESNPTDIGELFIQWRHPFGSVFNLKAGRLEPKLSLWKSTDRVTPTRFAPLTYTVGNSPFSTDSTQDALELNAIIGNRLFIAGGVVDRNGQDTKEGYGHISLKIGGTDFLGLEPEIDFDSESIWDYLTITFGTYGYSGKNGEIEGGRAISKNDFYRIGADMDLLYKRFRLKAGGVKGWDNNPYLTTGTRYVLHSVAAFSEAEIFLGSQIIAAGRFEYQEDDESPIVRRYIPAITYAPLQNTKIQLEYKQEEVSSTSWSAAETNRTTQCNLLFSF